MAVATPAVPEPLSDVVLGTIGANVFLCYQCIKCTSGCPLAERFDLTPNQVMRCLQVNDARQGFACRGPGLNIGPCVFGGYGTGGKKDGVPGNQWWFGGLLRNLRIRHRPTEE